MEPLQGKGEKTKTSSELRMRAVSFAFSSPFLFGFALSPFALSFARARPTLEFLSFFAEEREEGLIQALE